MLLYASLDFKFYKFYPLEAGVFVDPAGRDSADLDRFKQIQDFVRSKGFNEQRTIYQMIRAKNTQRVTFVAVFRYSEILALIFVGALRKAAILMMIGIEPSLFSS